MTRWEQIQARASVPGSAVLARVLPDLARANAERRMQRNVKAAFGENSVTQNLTVDELAKLIGAWSSTAAGVAVTPDTAGRVSAVYGCVALIAGAIATLPIGVFERDGDVRRKIAHDYWWLLNEQPNEAWAACSAWEYLVASRLFYGDAFAQLLRPSPNTNRIIGWKPLHPDRVQPFRAADGRVYYRVTDESGKQVIHDAADILHIPSLGFDGLRSPSAITYAAREAIGTALAAEEYSARFFAQGATFDYALQTEAKLDQAQIEVLRASLQAKYGGPGNSRMPLILTGGLKAEALSITPNDAALLPTRQFTVEEICRIFGVPPFMIGHTDKQTSWGTGVEAQGISFVKYTLRRYLTPIEQELNRKMWPTRARYFVEYNTAALERGDYKTRMEGYRVALGRAGEPGWMRVNEIRRLENMPPDDDLDAAAVASSEPAVLPIEDPSRNTTDDE